MCVHKDLPLRCTLLLILNEFRHLLNGVLRGRLHCDCGWIHLMLDFFTLEIAMLKSYLFCPLCCCLLPTLSGAVFFCVCLKGTLFFPSNDVWTLNSVAFLLLQQLWLTVNLTVTHSLPITQSFGLNGSTFVWCELSPILVCRKQRLLPYTTRPWIYRNMTDLRSLPRPTMSSWRRAC